MCVDFAFPVLMCVLFRGQVRTIVLDFARSVIFDNVDPRPVDRGGPFYLAEYRPPELVGAHSFTFTRDSAQRADVFALGAVLTGSPREFCLIL